MPVRSAPAPIQAVVRPLHLGLHEVEVELRVPPGSLEGGGILALPAWTPGSYMIRDYARLLDRFEARDARGRTLDTPKLDKQRWALPPTHGSVTVRYRLLCNDLTVRTNHVDLTHAQLVGAATFPRLVGQEGRPWQVRFEGWPAGWRVAAPLPRGAGAFRAADYDTLVDTPFEVGTFDLQRFEVAGTSFELALTGPHAVDTARLVDGTRRIVEVCGDLFGGFPFPRYLFLLTFSPGARGGLEHRDAASLLADPHRAATGEGLSDLFALVAHEFFHAWNVKRLRAAELGPFDYDRETPTRLLWFHEGFTSLVQYNLLLKAGLVDWPWVARRLGGLWMDNDTRAGRHEQSLEESSWDAWIRLYKPNEFSPNTTVSYYEKGAVVAWMMEARLRIGSGGRRGLEDLFRDLWRRIGDGHLSDADVREAFERLSGEPAAPFWDRWISGTAPLDARSIEKAFGLRFERRVPWDLGAPENGSPTMAPQAWSGLSFQGEAPVVGNVVPGSPAAEGGLSFGHEILAVDGWRTTHASDVLRCLGACPVGRAVEVLAVDRGRVRSHRLVLTESPERVLRIVSNPKASEAQCAAFRAFAGVPHPSVGKAR